MILKHTNWRFLLRELLSSPRGAFLGGISQENVKKLLAPQVAIAYWMATKLPHLLETKELRLLVIGANIADESDGGRWYGMLPVLLEQVFSVNVTIVGVELERTVTPYQHLANLCPPVTASFHKKTLAEFQLANPSANFDLAVMFQPGFEKHMEWLEDGSIKAIIQTGTPLMVTMYHPDEFLLERAVIEAYGFSFNGDMEINPFSLTSGIEAIDRISKWAYILCQFSPQVPEEGFHRDEELFEGLKTLTYMSGHSFRTKTEDVMAPASVELSTLGAPVTIPGGDGPIEAIHVFDEFYLDPVSQQMLEYSPANQRTASELDLTLPAEVVASYPTEDRGLARAIWAAKVKEQFILPFLDNDLADDEGGMFGADSNQLFRKDMELMPYMTIGMFLETDCPLQFIYAYMKTSRMVLEINQGSLSQEDLDEWNEAIAEAKKFLPANPKDLRTRREGLRQLLEENAPYATLFIWLRTGLVKEPGRRLSTSEENQWQEAAKEYDRVYQLYYSDMPTFSRH